MGKDVNKMAWISEETLLRLYGSSVSERRLELITETLWGEKMTLETLSSFVEDTRRQVEEWKNRWLDEEYPYVYLIRGQLRRRGAGKVWKVPVLVALGVNTGGFREIIGFCKGGDGGAAGWLAFFRNLESRGLSGAKLFISDDYPGLSEACRQVFPKVKLQRCLVDFSLGMFKLVPTENVKAVVEILSEVYAQADKTSALMEAKRAAAKLQGMNLQKARQLLEKSTEEILAYMSFPEDHRKRLRTDNALERAMLVTLRRNAKPDYFPDDDMAVLSICVGLRHYCNKNWNKRYMNMTKATNEVYLSSVS